MPFNIGFRQFSRERSFPVIVVRHDRNLMAFREMSDDTKHDRAGGMTGTWMRQIRGDDEDFQARSQKMFA
jgi:hypothetical protein